MRTANQLTGFYMRATLALNGLKKNIRKFLIPVLVDTRHLRVSFILGWYSSFFHYVIYKMHFF